MRGLPLLSLSAQILYFSSHTQKLSSAWVPLSFSLYDYSLSSIRLGHGFIYDFNNHTDGGPLSVLFVKFNSKCFLFSFIHVLSIIMFFYMYICLCVSRIHRKDWSVNVNNIYLTSNNYFYFYYQLFVYSLKCPTRGKQWSFWVSQSSQWCFQFVCFVWSKVQDQNSIIYDKRKAANCPILKAETREFL